MTDVAPSPVDADTGTDTVVHALCCRTPEAFCGAPISNVVTDTRPDCVVCEDMHPANQVCPAGHPSYCYVMLRHCDAFTKG